MWRWLLILAVFCLGIQANPVAAEENIDMKVNIPMNGIMKYGEWAKIEVKVINQGSDFDGQLQLVKGDEPGGSRDNLSKYKQQVHISAGEEKQLFFDIPNEFIFNSSMKLQLVKNDVVIDSEPLYLGNQNNGSWGAIVATNPNAFYFFSMKDEDRSEYPWIPNDWKTLSEKSIPEEAWILRNLQILALGDGASFNDKQIQAIKQWVREGGKLVISAGPHQAGVISKFQDVLPVAPEQSGTTTKLDLLKDMSGQKQLPIASLGVYNIHEPLFKSKQVGKGRILFVNYDVNEEPLASWQYNRQMWRNIVIKNDMDTYSSTPDGNVDSLDFTLMNLSRMIPGVSLPETEWLAVIWGVYLLLVGPLLYFVLKRRDRREWAWGLIPLFAILLSVGVYTIGRLQISKEDASYSVTRINIIDDHLARVNNISSFLAVSGGTYQVQAAKGFLTMPVNFERQMVGSTISYDPVNGNTITFENVPYLSQKMAVTSGIDSTLGSFQYKLSVEQNQLIGTITNQTTYDMQNVFIDLGMQRVTIGAMKKGETRQVQQPLKEVYMAHPNEQENPQMGPSVEQLHENIKADVAMPEINTMRIFGISTKPLPVIKMDSTNKSEYYYNVFRQGIRLSPSKDGYVHYPSGTLAAQMTQNEGNVNSTYAYIWEFGRGSATFVLEVARAGIDVKRVVIPLEQAPYRPFTKEIHNFKTKKWEKLGREERVVLDERLADYLNKEGSIEIRVTNETNQRLSMPTPYFTVEGEEK